MKELQRLVRIIDKFSHKSNPLINFQDNSKLETKLFYLLTKDSVQSDEAVAEELYGDKSLTGSYRTLKSRFRKKLYNHLHFLNWGPVGSKNVHEANCVCLSLLTEAQTLLVYSEQKLALKVFDQVLEIANAYGLNEMKIKALEGTKKIFLNLTKEKEFSTIVKVLANCYEIQVMERSAMSLYDHTMMTLRGPISQKSKYLQSLPSVLDELEELFNKSNSSLIFYHRHILNIAYLEQSGRYFDIVNTIAHAEKMVLSKNVLESWFDKKYNSFTEVYALLQSRQYDKGLKIAGENIQLFAKYSTNWFAFMENYVLLAIHSRQFEVAGVLLNEATENEHIKKLAYNSIERWELYRKYFIFLVSHSTNGWQENLPSEIASELLILPKDKSGFNLALLVLDVLEKLSEGEADELEGQAERLRKYTQKYLKGEKAERPRLFLRLLLLALMKRNAADARAQGQKLLEKLQATPLPGDAFTEVEIVPYEHLWELALQLLERRQV
ncbi:hypothetical protein [Pontibacter anaerobius]|uniref:Uncharacterized protein n=1 Tax=Pontibacter anaerobius TaxID=2993940 RepID=A0ABT3RHB2_9BACT|nr:hypothetical protein [Pontibacter anaerobius]MCX2740767.1 hypothetical protein [Pontibacter anaerobius]